MQDLLFGVTLRFKLKLFGHSRSKYFELVAQVFAELLQMERLKLELTRFVGKRIHPQILLNKNHRLPILKLRLPQPTSRQL